MFLSDEDIARLEARKAELRERSFAQRHPRLMIVGGALLFCVILGGLILAGRALFP